MIRIESLNNNGRFKAIGIFEHWSEKQINDCIENNKDYYLRMRSTGKKWKTLWKNFDKIERF